MTIQKVDIINELYVPVLKSLYITEKDGVLVRKFLGTERQVTADKREIVLPHQHLLTNFDNDHQIAFHPLSENVARGESTIQSYLKLLVTLHASSALLTLSSALATIASDKALQEDLNSEQIEILKVLPRADTKFRNILDNSLGKVDMKTIRLVNIYTRRNGKLNDSNYIRVTHVSFPLLDELRDPEKSAVWSAKEVRKRDLEDLPKLFDYILPGWNEPDFYSASSDNMHAPSFQSLMMAYAKIMTPIVSICKKFRSVFDRVPDFEHFSDMITSFDYVENLKLLDRYVNVIPPLDGNIGTVDSKDKTGETTARTPKARPPILDIDPSTQVKYHDGSSNQPAVQPQGQPVQQTQNQPQNNNGWGQNQGSNNGFIGNSPSITHQNNQGYHNQNNQGGWNNNQGYQGGGNGGYIGSGQNNGWGQNNGGYIGSGQPNQGGWGGGQGSWAGQSNGGYIGGGYNQPVQNQAPPRDDLDAWNRSMAAIGRDDGQRNQGWNNNQGGWNNNQGYQGGGNGGYIGGGFAQPQHQQPRRFRTK